MEGFHEYRADLRGQPSTDDEHPVLICIGGQARVFLLVINLLFFRDAIDFAPCADEPLHLLLFITLIRNPPR